jgi:hypothetical protein
MGDTLMSAAPLDDAAAPNGGAVRSVMLRLPEEIYEWLRTEAFLQRRSMNALGIEALLLLRARLEATSAGQPGRPEENGDPVARQP